jgi:hypothetical protein
MKIKIIGNETNKFLGFTASKDSHHLSTTSSINTKIIMDMVVIYKR